jgi:RNA-directed DNA polymerase
MERVLEREHLRRALRQVRRNRGAPGIDGMTVDGLVAPLTAHWPAIRSSRVDGTDTPQPVRRVEIPKAGGGTRHLGGPVVLDRVVEHAVWQGLHAEGAPTCSAWSDGVRPGRRAHQAGLARADGPSGTGTRGSPTVIWSVSSIGSTTTSS